MLAGEERKFKNMALVLLHHVCVMRTETTWDFFLQSYFPHLIKKIFPLYTGRNIQWRGRKFPIKKESFRGLFLLLFIMGNHAWGRKRKILQSIWGSQEKKGDKVKIHSFGGSRNWLSNFNLGRGESVRWERWKVFKLCRFSEMAIRDFEEEKGKSLLRAEPKALECIIERIYEYKLFHFVSSTYLLGDSLFAPCPDAGRSPPWYLAAKSYKSSSSRSLRQLELWKRVRKLIFRIL